MKKAILLIITGFISIASRGQVYFLDYTNTLTNNYFGNYIAGNELAFANDSMFYLYAMVVCNLSTPIQQR